MKLTILPAFLLALCPTMDAHSTTTTLTIWEQIHTTLNLYPMAIDLKNSSLFSSVFTPDATANYTGTFSYLPGLQNITDSLLLSVSQVLSQHQLGTTVIDIDACTEERGGCTASASTYFTATLFGLPGSANQGKYAILFGRYEDQLVDAGAGENGWRISRRDLVFMGPVIGDCELGGGCG